MNSLLRSAPSSAIALAILLALAAHAPLASAADKSPAATDEAALRKAGDLWNHAYKTLNVDALVALYAADAVVMPETAVSAKGHKSIRAFLKVYVALLSDSGFTPAVGKTVDIGVSGNLGVRSGTYSVADKSGTVVDNGKWLEIWRKTDGKWRITRDIWNSDVLPLFPPNAYTTGSIPAE